MKIDSIIIVDDSALARSIIKRCIEIAGFRQATIFEAENGREALELANSNSVDLIITDLNMPEMDGSSLLAKLTETPKFADVPVLVVTSASNPQKVKELREAGASAVLKKPISPAILAAAIERLGKSE